MDKNECCRMDISMLDEYVDNSLNRAENLIIEAHIKTCSSCRKHVSNLKLLSWELEKASKNDFEIPAQIKYLSSDIFMMAEKYMTQKTSTGKIIFANMALSLKNTFIFSYYIFPFLRTDFRTMKKIEQIKSMGKNLKDITKYSNRSYIKKKIFGSYGGKA